MKTYVVSLRDGAQVIQYTTHTYRPYAESQADVWKRMFPDLKVTIHQEHDGDEEPEPDHQPNESGFSIK